MITLSTTQQRETALNVYRGHATDHAPGVKNTIDILGRLILRNPNISARSASTGDEIARSMWAEINGERRYFCYDHENEKIAVKDKKGGRVLASFDDSDDEGTIRARLGI